MLYIIWGVSFLIGCLVAYIRWKIERKRQYEAVAELRLFEAAIREKSEIEVQALYSILGPAEAKRFIIEDYKIRHMKI